MIPDSSDTRTPDRDAVRRLLGAAATWLSLRWTGSVGLRQGGRAVVRRATRIVEDGVTEAARRAAAVELPPAPGAPSLSRREREIVTLLAAGLTYKEIARRLDLRYGAVHGTLRSLYRRFGVHTKDAMVRRLMRRP